MAAISLHHSMTPPVGPAGRGRWGRGRLTLALQGLLASYVFWACIHAGMPVPVGTGAMAAQQAAVAPVAVSARS